MNDVVDAETGEVVNVPATQKPKNAIAEFRGELENMGDQFKAALPAHIPAERFARVLMTAVQNNPDLLTKVSRRSLWNAAMRAAQDGLLPDGREGAIVPFKGIAQWLIMIGGLRKKVRNSGEIATWEVQVVHENDDFEFQLGDDPFIRHKPILEGEPGKVIAAYSIATLKSGEKSREVMTRAQIDKVRAVSRGGREDSPWNVWFEEMARKTVARRHSKVLPMSTDLDDLIRRDDELYNFDSVKDAEEPPAKRLTLGDKLDMLAGGNGDSHDDGPEITPEQQKQAAADAEKAKPKLEKKSKASAVKAEEAAGADAGKAGAQPSPQASETTSPSADAPATDPGTAADSPPAAKSADAAVTPPAAASAATGPKPMTAAHRTGLQRMHNDMMMKAMGRKKAQEFFDAFVQANELAEGDAAYKAAEAVLLAHFNRIAGESSPAEADAALNKAIAP